MQLVRRQEARPGRLGRLHQIRVGAVALGPGLAADFWPIDHHTGSDCRRRADHADPLNGRAPVYLRDIGLGGVVFHHRAPCLARVARWSLDRQASARIDSVGFLSGLDTSTAPSVTNRLGTAQDWPN